MSKDALKSTFQISYLCNIRGKSSDEQSAQLQIINLKCICL